MYYQLQAPRLGARGTYFIVDQAQLAIWLMQLFLEMNSARFSARRWRILDSWSHLTTQSISPFSTPTWANRGTRSCSCPPLAPWRTSLGSSRGCCPQCLFAMSQRRSPSLGLGGFGRILAAWRTGSLWRTSGPPLLSSFPNSPWLRSTLWSWRLKRTRGRWSSTGILPGIRHRDNVNHDLQ